MAHVAERVRIVQRRGQPAAKRPPVAGTLSSGTKAQPHTQGPVASRVAAPVSEIAGGLPARLRSGVEALSGIAMDDVRVHRNSSEPAKLGALAFTRGTGIHLGPGQEQHLPHEAWHVVQQKQGRVRATAQMKDLPINDDRVLEREADRMGRTAAAPPDGTGLTHELRTSYRAEPRAIQLTPGDPPKSGLQIFGGTSSTAPTVKLYHYGDLTNVKDFTSSPGYPRLTEYDGATSKVEASKFTGTPIRNSLRYKYELVVDEAYFHKNFSGAPRGGYWEYGTKKPIPTIYFTKVATLTGTTPAGGVPTGGPTGSGSAPTTPPASGAGGASSKAAGAAAASMESKTATTAVKRGASLGARAAQAGLGFLRGAALFTAAELLIEAAIGWLTYKKDNYPFDWKAVKFAGFLNSKLEAQMAAAISAEAQQARQMAIDHPEFPVFAIVSFDLDYRWTGASAGAAAVPNKDMNYIDARMVSLELGYHPQSKEVVLSKAVDYRDRIDTKRVTISIELNPLNETSAQKKWRSFSTDAARAASRGLSARHVAGRSHFAPDVSRADLAEEERRKKWGGPSWLDERELEERKLWVRAYIEYTAFHGPDNLYADAVKYLAELERQEPRSTAPRFNAKAKALLPQSGPAMPMMPSN